MRARLADRFPRLKTELETRQRMNPFHLRKLRSNEDVFPVFKETFSFHLNEKKKEKIILCKVNLSEELW